MSKVRVYFQHCITFVNFYGKLGSTIRAFILILTARTIASIFNIRRERKVFVPSELLDMASKEPKTVETKSPLGLLIVEGGFEDQVSLKALNSAKNFVLIYRICRQES